MIQDMKMKRSSFLNPYLAKPKQHKTRILGVGDDLYHISREMEQYKGFTINLLAAMFRRFIRDISALTKRQEKVLIARQSVAASSLMIFFL